ncbi:MAG TPA: glucuronate isomerase, partial [Pirellulaceae bacterium]|nr:glucuronate isomerase [Pirellulaceae bacterium]
HINALLPASRTLADILGYHYYTELAHSAGMAKSEIEEPDLDPKEKVHRLIERMGPIDNTIQYSWFIEMCQTLFGFQGDRVTLDNWETLYDKSAEMMAAPDWAELVLAKSKLEGVFLTNDFDDPLEDFDTNLYIPCLRTDDLVFQLSKPQVQQRLAACTGVDVTNGETLKFALSGLFQYFCSKNAKACAISLPPDFSPVRVSDNRADTAIAALYGQKRDHDGSHQRAVSNYVFWALAELAAEYQLPFDLMIGVNRSVYPGGVHQGQDLYDSRVSLFQYKELFNAFPQVTFPVSVLASVTNQELASYAWIFPNVVTNGHWWYSNTPTFIEHDLAARLEAVPRTKQIGYYSDMYKLEFALPKFAMYKRILAKVLAEKFVQDRGWNEEQAVALGKQLLRGNVDQIFSLGKPHPLMLEAIEMSEMSETEMEPTEVNG